MRAKFLAVPTLVALILAGCSLVGCSAAPKNEEKKTELSSAVKSELASMKEDDPSLDAFLKKSYAYVLFPSVGKGGFVVGGAYGRGEVYEQDKLIGYADITQATVGAQVGGQSFAELICFENKAALDQLVNGEYTLAAQASAVALASGAASNAKYRDGVAIFTHVKKGLMVEAAIGGQKFKFVPIGY
jgi:lipid-binding SYLF domain-containing protein